MNSRPDRTPTPDRRRRRRSDAGFSLIELLVVLVILGLLAGLVGPRVLDYLGGARAKTAKLQIENLKSALDLYRLDVGAYPPSEAGLAALVRKPAGAATWNGPYISTDEVPKDPWGNPYQYRSPGDQGRPFEIVSLGADNRRGGEGDNADITSW